MTDKTQRMEYAKARLLERFRQQTPRRAPPGQRLPPGQHLTTGFPILDLGIHPAFNPQTWRLRVEGLVENPLVLSYAELLALPKTTVVADFHCVTTWSKYDVTWGGWAFRALLERVIPRPEAAFVIQTSGDGYTTNVALAELLSDDIVLAYELEGQPLPLEHGGPLRITVPQLYAWKSAKFLHTLTFCAQDQPGYWEQRGYHNHGDPWNEERYG